MGNPALKIYTNKEGNEKFSSLFVFGLILFSFVLAGCQAAPTPNASNNVPYSRGPDTPPHVNGPNIPLPTK